MFLDGTEKRSIVSSVPNTSSSVAPSSAKAALPVTELSSLSQRGWRCSLHVTGQCQWISCLWGTSGGGAVFAKKKKKKSWLIFLLFCCDGANCNLIVDLFVYHPRCHFSPGQRFWVRGSSGVVCFNVAGNPRWFKFSILWWHTCDPACFWAGLLSLSASVARCCRPIKLVHFMPLGVMLICVETWILVSKWGLLVLMLLLCVHLTVHKW